MTPALLLIIALAANSPDPAGDAWNSWLAGDFGRVAQIAQSSGNDTTLTAPQRGKIFLALGCSQAMQGRDDDAKGNFRAALGLDPFPNLTAADLPPPAWRLFAPLRDEALAVQAANVTPVRPVAAAAPTEPKQPPAIVKTDTIRLAKPIFRSRPAIIRSLVVPGLGQLTEGRKRGYLFLGAEAAAAAGWIYAASMTADAHREYLNARGTQAGSKYDRYNRWYRLSWGMGVATVATYLAAQIDFFSSPPPLTLTQRQGELGLALSLRL